MPLVKPPLGSLLNPADSLAKGMVGAWLLGEQAGDRAADSAGRYPGGLTNAPARISGPYGPGLSFAASSTSYVDCGVSPVLTNAVSLALLVRYTASTSTRHHFGRGFGGSSVPFCFWNGPESSQNIAFGFYSGSWTQAV